MFSIDRISKETLKDKKNGIIDIVIAKYNESFREGKNLWQRNDNKTEMNRRGTKFPARGIKNICPSPNIVLYADLGFVVCP